MTFQEAANLLKTKGGSDHLKGDVAETNAFQEAWKVFDSVVALVPSELKLVKKHSWQNSGAITTYAWLMFTTEPYRNILKQKKLKNLEILPLTISFFCNKIGNDDYSIRVCLELFHEAIAPSQLSEFYRVLSEISIVNGLTTFDENTDKRLPRGSAPFSKAFFETLGSEDNGEEFFSVGFSYALSDDNSLKEKIKDSFEKILPLYEEIMGKCDKRIKSANQSAGTLEIGDKKPDDNPTPRFPKNLIFYGAPGTGKTYRTVNQAVAICKGVPVEQINIEYKDNRKKLTEIYRGLIASGDIRFVTFHQSYTYEDFVIGIFPELANGKNADSQGLRYIRKDGIFKALCDTARVNEKKNFVLIIDEINRGNISKIFGELITLIEDTKREGQPEETTVLLPYLDNENIISFSVPNNVYIIGTMNTADRSIQHVDTALRRRFVFEEVLPDTDLLKSVDINVEGATLNIAKLLESINRRIKRYFDREHVIGHAYFMELAEQGLSDLERLARLGDIFRDRIIPLLQDYFFEDYSKIQRVLGESDAPEGAPILIKKIEELGEDEEGDGREVYEVAPKGDPVYSNIQTYILMTK